MNIGFVGAGVMGAPMARNLQAAGHKLLLYKHRSPLPADLLEGGAGETSSLADLAGRSDVVILMLPDTPDVEQALLGEGGVVSGLKSGSTVIDMSSISPEATKRFGEKVEARGCDYLDAPVSGGEIGAKNATLTIMVGGRPEAFERVLALFKTMGSNINRIGGIGDGQIAKIANQIIVALTIEAVSEGLLFASKAGADPAKVRSALMGGFAASRILEVHGERMLNRTFDPGFRIGLHQKDLGLALAGARSVGMSLPSTALAQELFNACAARGGAGWDHSAMIVALEALADHRLA